MFDASAFCGFWAFRNTAARSLHEVCDQLAQTKLLGAAISPIEAILHPEPMAANRRFLHEVTAYADTSFIVYPVPIINPSLVGWEDHVTQCIEIAGGYIPAIKLVPGYHGYDFSLPSLHKLAALLIYNDITLCLQMRMEDARASHAITKVSIVETMALKNFAKSYPQLSILVCAPYFSELGILGDAPNIRVELSFIETGHVLQDTLKVFDPTRILIGTHAPLFMPAMGIRKAFADDVDDKVRNLLIAENFINVFSKASDKGGCDSTNKDEDIKGVEKQELLVSGGIES